MPPPGVALRLLFRLEGRPHLAHVRVETTDVSAYQALLEGVAS